MAPWAIKRYQPVVDIKYSIIMAFWAIIISYFDSDLSVPRTHTPSAALPLHTPEPHRTHQHTPEQSSTHHHSPEQSSREESTPAHTRAEQQRAEGGSRGAQEAAGRRGSERPIKARSSLGARKQCRPGKGAGDPKGSKPPPLFFL